MLKKTLLALAPVLILGLASFDADAARLGGGKSFGSKPSYGNSYSSPSPSSPSQQGFSSSSRSANENSFSRTAQPAGGGFLSRFGGLGGMFGGLLVGGLLGSLLFGGGHGFGGPGLFDILLIAGGGWLLFKFLKSRRASQAEPQPASASGYAYSEPPRPQAQNSWDALRSTPSGSSATGSSEQTGPSVPPGFDADEFLAGAKAAYNRLQASWDKRDLADIKTFVTPEVFAEIKSQADQDPNPGKTDVLLVNARLLEARREGDRTVATVFFDTLLREDQTAREPTQTREVWHFSRSESAPGDMWRLEGIQQLAA